MRSLVILAARCQGMDGLRYDGAQRHPVDLGRLHGILGQLAHAVTLSPGGSVLSSRAAFVLVTPRWRRR